MTETAQDRWLEISIKHMEASTAQQKMLIGIIGAMAEEQRELVARAAEDAEAARVSGVEAKLRRDNDEAANAAYRARMTVQWDMQAEHTVRQTTALESIAVSLSCLARS